MYKSKLAILFLLTACAGPPGPEGPAGSDGSPCASVTNSDGSYTITCPDSDPVTVRDGAVGTTGAAGADGQSCGAEDNGDGSYTITCPDSDPVTVRDGADGEQGATGADGSSCSAEDNGDGSYTITCPDSDPITVRDGANGANGQNGQNGQRGDDGDDGADGNDGADGDDCSAEDNGDGTLTIRCGDQEPVVVRLPRCGDGIVAGGEECDDGNAINDDGCTVTCARAQCGDGILRRDVAPGGEGYEACDDGNLITEACLYGEEACTVCAEDCSQQPGAIRICGDGILDGDDGEACDDGNAIESDACLSDCTAARCGDGFVRIEPAPEVCSAARVEGRSLRVNWRPTLSASYEAVTIEAYVRGVQNGDAYLFMSYFDPNCSPVWMTGGLAGEDWQHVAAVLRGNHRTLFVNGAVIATGNIGCQGGQLGPNGLIIGGAADEQHRFDGYMQGLRFTEGAVYEGEFVPTSDYGVDENTLFYLPLNTAEGEPLDEGPYELSVDNLGGFAMGAADDGPYCGGDRALEACDDGANNADDVPDACRLDCTAPVCGDGVVDSGEACDDGNDDPDDDCDNCRGGIREGLIAHYDMSLTDGGQLADQSGNDHHGTLVGAVNEAEGLSAGPARHFNGLAAVVHLPEATIVRDDNPRTVMLWFRSGTRDNWRYFFAFGAERPNQTFSGRICDNGKIGFMGHANDHDPCVGPRVDDDQWRFVAYTYDGSTLKGYVDGNMLWEHGLGALNTDQPSARIGQHVGNSPSDLSARMDEFRIYNRALSSDEIREMYLWDQP